MEWILCAVFQIFLVTLVQGYIEVRSICRSDRPEHCFTLYKKQTVPLTWSQAQQACKDHNQTIAMVRDANIQSVMTQLIQTGPDTGAWTAGQVRNSNRWQGINGKFIQNFNTGGSGNCLYLQVGTTTEVKTASCTAPMTSLCSKGVPASGCVTEDVRIGTLCMRQLHGHISWYSAMAECENLGYKPATYDAGLSTQNPVAFGKISGNMWLDVHRHPWVWSTGTGFVASMTYYNWDSQPGMITNGSCMYINGNGSRWKSQPCDSTTGVVTYFVCEIDNTISTTSTFTTSTVTATSPSETNSSANSNEALSGSGLSKKHLYIIIAVIAACVLIIIIVAIAICTRRRRNRKAPRRPQSREMNSTDAPTDWRVTENPRPGAAPRESGERSTNTLNMYYSDSDTTSRKIKSRKAGGARKKTKGKHHRQDTKINSSLEERPMSGDLPPGEPQHDSVHHNNSWGELVNDYVRADSSTGENADAKATGKGSRNKKEPKYKKHNGGKQNKGYDDGNEAKARDQNSLNQSLAISGSKPSSNYYSTQPGRAMESSEPASAQQVTDPNPEGFVSSDVYAKVNKPAKAQGLESLTDSTLSNEEDVIVDNAMYSAW